MGQQKLQEKQQNSDTNVFSVAKKDSIDYSVEHRVG